MGVTCGYRLFQATFHLSRVLCAVLIGLALSLLAPVQASYAASPQPGCEAPQRVTHYGKLTADQVVPGPGDPRGSGVAQLTVNADTSVVHSLIQYTSITPSKALIEGTYNGQRIARSLPPPTSNTIIDDWAAPAGVGRDMYEHPEHWRVVLYTRQYPSGALSTGPLHLTSINACGLIRMWALDEGSGTTTKSIMDSNETTLTGTLYNGASWTSGKFGSAISFTGAGSYVSLDVSGSPSATAPQSLAAWLKVPAIPSSGTQTAIGLFSHTSQSGVFMGLRDGQLAVWQYGGTILASVPAPAANAWHQVSYTFDGTTHRLYVNGALGGSSTQAAQRGTPERLILGGFNGGEWLLGNVDTLRIYSRALTDGEVRDLVTRP